MGAGDVACKNWKIKRRARSTLRPWLADYWILRHADAEITNNDTKSSKIAWSYPPKMFITDGCPEVVPTDDWPPEKHWMNGTR